MGIRIHPFGQCMDQICTLRSSHCATASPEKPAERARRERSAKGSQTPPDLGIDFAIISSSKTKGVNRFLALKFLCLRSATHRFLNNWLKSEA
jgi:hypothetical protein